MALRKQQRAFLEAYKITAGQITKAAECAGVDRSRHYHWLEDDEYRAAFATAEKEAAQAIESEAIRRAVEGVEMPVVHRGRIVQVPVMDADGKPMLDAEFNPVMKPLLKREYSDTIILALLRGWMPGKYMPTEKREHSGPAGGAIDIKVSYV